jgi:aminoglycoside 2'-N-acetyltransferase I
VLTVVTAEPGELSRSDLAAAQALVRSAFGANFRDHDWLHGVDGVHVVVTDDAALLAHAAVVPRSLRHDGDVFETGYVEGVAVHADERGRGLGHLVMDHAETLVRKRFQMGALNAIESAAPFYARRGWQRWDGRTEAETPNGQVDTFDPADRIFLLPPDSGRRLSAATPLICDWRVGDLW